MKLRQARTALAIALVVVATATMIALRRRALPAASSTSTAALDGGRGNRAGWEGRRLVFLVRAAHPPFSFFPPGKDEPCGLGVDVARSVAENLGVQALLVALPWQELEARFLAGEGDVLLASTCATAANRHLYRFTAPYCRSRPVLLVVDAAYQRSRSGVPPGTNVAVLAGSFSGRLSKEWEGDETTAVRSWSELVSCLREGRCDAALVDVLSAHYRLVREPGGDLAILDAGALVSGSSSVSMVVRRGALDLAQALDGALWDMQRSAALRRIHRRYCPFDIE